VVRRSRRSRGITLPDGHPDDAPDQSTVYGLGARKNLGFLEQLRHHGVSAYPSAVALLTQLRALGMKTAVVTASENRAEVLSAARLESLFDATVDGHDRRSLGLRGKPLPDTYLEAARRLGVSPARAIVVEDAVAGVEAGRAGGFGLVIGVDRTNHSEALRAHGADVVVSDLSWIETASPGEPQAEAPPVDPWLLEYDGFDPAVEGRRETLFALGNGYFVTRGAAAEARADDVHYPGTYLAGGYNRLTSAIDGRAVEHEDLVNLPNWLPLTFRIEDGEWFDLTTGEILAYRQSLDLRRGLYERIVRIRDPHGRDTRLIEQRFVHMDEQHLAGQRMTIVAENWSGRVTLRAQLDGEVTNAGVVRYRSFEGAHVRVTDAVAVDAETLRLDAETTQSRLGISIAARIRLCGGGSSQVVRRSLIEQSRIGLEISVVLDEGARVEIEKVVALYTTRDRAIADPATDALIAVGRAGTFDELLATHALAWSHLWERCDLETVEVDADASHHVHLIVRLHVFHLLQTASRHTMELDVGIAARGWHGEAYRGHVFWDELFIFPFLVTRMPMLARALMLYRYRRLPEARWAARAAGYRGAMFPWQSGSNGREETDVLYLNPRSGRWIRDDTRLQRHVGAAVAYNVWQYYQATGDSEFLFVYGAELLLEIAAFWSSIAEWNAARGRYDIRGVLGPDEFHDRYPDRVAPGLANNAYTNLMAAWCLARALGVLELLPDERRNELRELLGLTDDEIARWGDVSRKLYVPFHDDGVVSQFEGYEKLPEFDWDRYRQHHGDIGRLDLVLEAEGDSPNRYKASKQADVLMLFYLFTAEELGELFARLGYAFDGAMIPRTIEYYLARTSHGSTLSGIVSAWVLSRASRARSWPLFLEALHSDVEDVQGGTTPEGIHLGAMAGTIDLLQRCYTGLELRGDALRFHPALPDELRRLSFQLRYRNHSLSLDLTASTLTVASAPGAAGPITIVVDEQRVELEPGGQRSIVLAR
jgi:HAD superfamily hydrolase (TIGR01509 family)